MKFQHLKGQGLIETLMIILFIGVSALALIGFQRNLTYNALYARQQSTATLVTLKQIETLRNFSVLNTTAGYVAYSGIATGSGSSTVGNTTYNMSWTVTTDATLNYKTIDITTTWTDSKGAASSVRFVTRVAGVDPAIGAKFM